MDDAIPLTQDAMDEIEALLGGGRIDDILVEPAELAAFTSGHHWKVTMTVARPGFHGTTDFTQTWEFLIDTKHKSAVDYLVDRHEEAWPNKR